MAPRNSLPKCEEPRFKLFFLFSFLIAIKILEESCCNYLFLDSEMLSGQNNQAFLFVFFFNRYQNIRGKLL